jgi:hypothetical protein
LKNEKNIPSEKEYYTKIREDSALTENEISSSFENSSDQGLEKS